LSFATRHSQLLDSLSAGAQLIGAPRRAVATS